MVDATRHPVRIAVVGAGAFGREHLDRLAARDDVAIVGVVEPSRAASDVVKGRHPAIPLFTDPVDMFDEVRPDAAIVATPAATHFGITSAGISRRVPVLLEKPVLPSSVLAAELVAMTNDGTAFILPGHVLRFSADHVKLASLVKSGTIGDIIYIDSRRYRDASHARRYPDTDPVLMTLIHDIDLAVWLAPEPFVSVRGSRTAGPGFQSLTTADLETASGIRCHLRTAWTFTDGDLPPDRLEVVGECGSIELDAGHSLRLYVDGRCTELPLTSGDDPLANEHDCFVARIRNSQAPLPVSMNDAIIGLKLAEAILQSLASRREVAVSW